MIVTTELALDLLRDIGDEGLHSTVRVARDHQLNAQIAVKIIPVAAFNHPDEYFQEARMLYDVQHPHVVEVMYGCRQADNIYIAMPLYGESLNSVLSRKVLTVREAIRYGLDFLKGVHRIHTKRMVHFDIKPTNILLDASGRAAVSDFGLSKYVDAHGFAEQPYVYDSHLPPEWFTEQYRGTESDIYQSGVTLYRLVNGAQHFDAQIGAIGRGDTLDAAIRAGEFPDRNNYLLHVPARLRTAINKAMSVNRDERHATALDLMNDIAAVDQNLDWVYESDGDTQRWTYAADNHHKRVEYHRDDAGQHILSCSRAYHSGQVRVQKNLSGQFRTPFLLQRALTKALTEL